MLALAHIRLVLDDEASSLEELIERDNLWPPRVPPVKFKGTVLGNVDPSVGLKLPKRTDDETRTRFDVEQDFAGRIACVASGDQLMTQGLDCGVDARLHLGHAAG
jgi:hypothetical protein